MTMVSRVHVPDIPASFFGIVVGLAGLANDWRAGHKAWGLPAIVGEGLFVLAGAVWAIMMVLYAVKAIVTPASVRDEALHPVQCCFIALIGVATLLMALGILPYSRPLAILLYAAGTLLVAAFALWRTGLLWRGQRDPSTTTPILYIPSVAGGFVSAAVAGALGWTEWGQLAFGAGFFSWLAIESVVLHRLYTGETLPPALRPTLGLKLAPPAVGALAYVSVSGGHSDLISHFLLGYALFHALLLARIAGWMAEQPFNASYWAMTFGGTALAGATVRLAANTPGSAFAFLAPITFIAANLLVLGIVTGTVRLVARHQLLPTPAPLPQS